MFLKKVLGRLTTETLGWEPSFPISSPLSTYVTFRQDASRRDPQQRKSQPQKL